MKEKKFKKGAKLTTLEAVSIIQRGGWIYYRHKPYHPGWSQSWGLRTIINAARRGWLFKAIRIDNVNSRTN